MMFSNLRECGRSQFNVSFLFVLSFRNFLFIVTITVEIPKEQGSELFSLVLNMSME